MVIDKNKVCNLTSITDYNAFIIKHILDSIKGSEQFIKEGASVIDIGTGAGFPGIPLKIYYPSIRITLLDSLRKRCDFLEEVGRELKFKHFEVIHGRAEEFAHNPRYREAYDTAVSRAVASLPVLLEYCMGYVRPGGVFAAYKSEKAEEELKDSMQALKILGGSVGTSIAFDLPEDMGKRVILLLLKKKSLGKNKYPRKQALIKSHPLSGA